MVGLSGCITTLPKKESFSSAGGTLTTHMHWGPGPFELQQKANYRCSTVGKTASPITEIYGARIGEYDQWSFVCTAGPAVNNTTYGHNLQDSGDRHSSGGASSGGGSRLIEQGLDLMSGRKRLDGSRPPSFSAPSSRGFMIQKPGSIPTYVTPRGAGGYMIQTPGRNPSYITPR